MTSLIISGIILAFTVLTVALGIRVVPQSKVYVVERFGKYTRTLNAGLSFVVPYIDTVAHRISILERQLDEFDVSVITKDNVEVDLTTTVFYRVEDASKSVYRIQDVDSAIHTAATSIVRSAAGKLELDELQSSRELMAQEILTNLELAAEIWGIDITRTEITDVVVDEKTKQAQRQQLNAERERRAAVTKAEGEKRSVELAAEATLFAAKKEAEAVRVAADAQAHATKVAGEAEAEAIEKQGQALKKSPDMVALEKARRWSGELPKTFIGGDKTPNMLFNLDGDK